MEYRKTGDNIFAVNNHNRNIELGSSNLHFQKDKTPILLAFPSDSYPSHHIYALIIINK